MGIADMLGVLDGDRGGGGIAEPMWRQADAEGAIGVYANAPPKSAELKLRGDLGDPERIDIGRHRAALTAQQNGPVVLEITREAGEQGLREYRLPRLPGLGLVGAEHQPVAFILAEELVAQTDGGEILDSQRTIGFTGFQGLRGEHAVKLPTNWRM